MSTPSREAQTGAPKGGRLPIYYPITALVVLMLFDLAGGLIAYRIGMNARVERVHAADSDFISRIAPIASAAARKETGQLAALQEAARQEMGARPVVKVRVYDEDMKVVFSTDAPEMGTTAVRDYDFYFYGDPTTKMIHADTFKSGGATLRDRDLIITGASSGDYSIDQVYTEVYSDVTADIQSANRTIVLITGGIMLGLAGVLVFVLIRARREKLG